MWTWLLVSAVCLATQAPDAKADEAAYSRAIEKRAADVLDELKLEDRAAADRVRGAIVDQYRGLRALHDARDAKVREIQADGGVEEAARAGRIEAERPRPRRRPSRSTGDSSPRSAEGSGPGPGRGGEGQDDLS